MRILKTLFGYPGVGIVRDIKSRWPYYASDWTDAINYRVVPASVYMYFCNLLPAIAFAQDMFDKTNNSYGVNEVLLASAMGGIVFGLLAGQPLCIVGVTGPVAIFNYTIYEIITPRGTPYFAFMCWVCLWAMVMHFIIAIFNWVSSLKYITRYSCDVFGFFICYVYIQKGIQICTRQFNILDGGSVDQAATATTMGYMSVMVALLVLIVGYLFNYLGSHTKLFTVAIRKFLLDYGTPLTVVFFTGFIHFGQMSQVSLARLPTTKSFTPTDLVQRPHGWFIHFWEIDVADVFLAIPFALLMTFLFYFDHNVSSLICQGSEYPLKKPASFHWDFLLLGVTTGAAGILGIPAPNGLIPQAPLHTSSLCVQVLTYDDDKGQYSQVTDHVVEQRVSNFVQGLLILGTMSGPLLIVLGLVPQCVLAGLFWVMGFTGLQGNGVTNKLIYIFTDKRYIPQDHPLNSVKKTWYFYAFVVLELIAFGFEFGITQTVAAVGFPGVLLFFAAVAVTFPYWIPHEILTVLDEPTAEEFIMANLNITPPEDDSDTASSKRASTTLTTDQIYLLDLFWSSNFRLLEELENGEKGELRARSAIRLPT
ncbi:hypothetical protein NADFUDRAFT_73580 [Nadsonia fulvescens var. elongata DSM 6958]|uniref:Bicarbonate transporter-like transmembrane domain-containing protein n=1 Tax=Nadsonia fulvescens var. elongata DSM 6958 TaxID=857566 RepID=A0A1E3PMB3_9ASCO|nr:hypothetical protein NADFUDRAFT_73580 [Nadsonia fulvescens var. elongata DSM 6958]